MTPPFTGNAEQVNPHSTTRSPWIYTKVNLRIPLTNPNRKRGSFLEKSLAIWPRAQLIQQDEALS